MVTTMIYEAHVLTDCGSYRAFTLAGHTVAISEDGMDGFIDYIHIDPVGLAGNAPENLVQLLIEWVYEFRRGEQLLNAVLTRRS